MKLPTESQVLVRSGYWAVEPKRERCMAMDHVAMCLAISLRQAVD